MKIGILVAMDRELDQLSGLFKRDNVIVEKCGIGKVNAALGTAAMIHRHQPDLIISSGCAGGFGDDVNVQDVVVAVETTYHDVYCGMSTDGCQVLGQVQGMPARYPSDRQLLAMARALQERVTDIRIAEGLIVTGDWFVDSREKMADIVSHFPDTKAIDMESAAIAQACYRFNVPFISFRVISDKPMEDCNTSQYHDFWSRLADHSFQVTSQFVESILANSER